MPEAKSFLKAYPDDESLTSISDCIKYCRYKKNPTRKQISMLIGDASDTYSDLERDKPAYTPTNLGTRRCTLFEISLSDLQDTYTAFLRFGKGTQIKNSGNPYIYWRYNTPIIWVSARTSFENGRRGKEPAADRPGRKCSEENKKMPRYI